MSEPMYADQNVADALDDFEAVEQAREEGRRELAWGLYDRLAVALAVAPGDSGWLDLELLWTWLAELAPGWREEDPRG